MEKSVEASDDRIPTYEESILSGAGASTGSSSTTHKRLEQAPHPPSLTQQLAHARTERIRAIVSAHINPLFEAQAFSGLFKTTIVLVPSSAQSLQAPADSGNDVIEGSGDSISHNTAEAVIGFPDDDYVKLVRLHGEENSTEFWRQLAVINELESTLKASLTASGHTVYEKSQFTEPTTSYALNSQIVPEVAKRRGFFSRMGRSESASTSPFPLVPAGTDAPAGQEAALSPGHIRVGVSLEEVVLRVVTNMGLYDTRTGKAVVVRLEIGS